MVLNINFPLDTILASLIQVDLHKANIRKIITHLLQDEKTDKQKYQSQHNHIWYSMRNIVEKYYHLLNQITLM